MADVVSISSSVVREYLSRKGLKETLTMLDKEMPRTDNCISNRAQLAKELHINTLMKKNKERQEGFRTMLEVIVQFMMSKPSSKQNAPILAESERKSRPSTPRDRGTTEGGTSGNIGGAENQIFGGKTESSGTRQNMKHKVKSPVGMTDDKLRSSVTDNNDSRMDQVSCDLDVNIQSEKSKRQNPMTFTQGERLRTSVPEKSLKEHDNTILVENSVVKKQTSFTEPPSIKSLSAKKGSRRVMGSIAGGVMSTGLHSAGKKKTRSYGEDGLRGKPKYFQDEWNENHQRKTSGKQQTPRNEELIPASNERTKNAHKDFKEKGKNLLEDAKESSDFQGGRTCGTMEKQGFVSKKELNVVPDWKKEILQKKDIRQNVSQLKTTKNEDLIFEDIDETLDDELQKMNFNVSPRKSTSSVIPCQAISLKQAKDLKTVVFGSAVSSFNSEWRHQGFTFSSFDDLKYGIIQHKGGPCGLLASVQAVVLKQLLFNDHLSGNKQHLHFSAQETNDALASALTEILWRAGSYKTARIAVRSEKKQFLPSTGYKADRLTEKLVIHETNSCVELGTFIKQNITQFSCDDGGCILLLYSVILSRTVEKIKEDMDDENGTLMGAHGYCTQDMVNLFLTGKAISNTFDDVIELDSGGDTKNILKGIDQQSDIGLLSLFEHYKSCLVGLNLKTPKYPIWVVCSESHFSVLFSMKRSLLNERRSQKKFDLYYYDGLAGQNEEIRLTIDISGDGVVHDPSHDLTPPLEHCIRTKWKNALIDWNGTEPLL